jgi:hypothetical protein
VKNQSKVACLLGHHTLSRWKPSSNDILGGHLRKRKGYQMYHPIRQCKVCKQVVEVAAIESDIEKLLMCYCRRWNRKDRISERTRKEN